MEKTDTDPDAYLASLPEDDRDTMVAIDGLIRAAMPDRNRTVWEGTFWGGSEQTIIGYGDITQPRPRGADVEWFAVGLARQKDYVSVYVNAIDDGEYLTQRYAERLGKVKIGASSVSFKRLDDLDLGAFTEFITRANELTI